MCLIPQRLHHDLNIIIVTLVNIHRPSLVPLLPTFLILVNAMKSSGAQSRCRILQHGRSSIITCGSPAAAANSVTTLGTPRRLFLSLSLLFPGLVLSDLVNITVDDQLGDPSTGLAPEYSPKVGSWHLGSPSEDCPSCSILPSMLDLTQIHDETWLDATYWPSDDPAAVAVHFTGSAVYVFNIVPNTLRADTFTNISFSIDGGDITLFTHSPDPSNTILYKHLVYQSAFNHAPHTLVMTPANNSLILFDYLIYTTLSNDNTTSPPDTTSTDNSTSTRLPNNTSQPSSSHTPTSITSPVGSPRSLPPSSVPASTTNTPP